VEGSGRGRNLKYCVGMCLPGLRVTTKISSEVSGLAGRYLNTGPPDYGAGMLPATQKRLGLRQKIDRSSPTHRMITYGFTSERSHDFEIILNCTNRKFEYIRILLNNSSANIGIRLGVSGFSTAHRSCKWFAQQGGGQHNALEDFK
jgi:hypothetical protein